MCRFGFLLFWGSGQHIFQRNFTKFRTELQLSNADFILSGKWNQNRNRILGMCKFQFRFQLVHCGTITPTILYQFSQNFGKIEAANNVACKINDIIVSIRSKRLTNAAHGSAKDLWAQIRSKAKTRNKHIYWWVVTLLTQINLINTLQVFLLTLTVLYQELLGFIDKTVFYPAPLVSMKYMAMRSSQSCEEWKTLQLVVTICLHGSL